jgi:hypothetical protein
MTTSDSRAASAEALASLTPLAPDPSRTAAVRLRCRSRIARGTTRARRTGTVAGSLARVFVPLLLGAFSAYYAAALLTATLHFEGMLR